MRSEQLSKSAQQFNWPTTEPFWDLLTVSIEHILVVNLTFQITQQLGYIQSGKLTYSLLTLSRFFHFIDIKKSSLLMVSSFPIAVVRDPEPQIWATDTIWGDSFSLWFLAKYTFLVLENKW